MEDDDKKKREPGEVNPTDSRVKCKYLPEGKCYLDLAFPSLSKKNYCEHKCIGESFMTGSAPIIRYREY